MSAVPGCSQTIGLGDRKLPRERFAVLARLRALLGCEDALMRGRVAVSGRDLAMLGSPCAPFGGAAPGRGGAHDDLGARDRAGVVKVCVARFVGGDQHVAGHGVLVARERSEIARTRCLVSQSGGLQPRLSRHDALLAAAAPDLAREFVHPRIHAAAEVAIAGVLIAIRRPLIAIGAALVDLRAGLIAISEGLIGVRMGLIALGQRLLAGTKHRVTGNHCAIAQVVGVCWILRCLARSVAVLPRDIARRSVGHSGLSRPGAESRRSPTPLQLTSSTYLITRIAGRIRKGSA